MTPPSPLVQPPGALLSAAGALLFLLGLWLAVRVAMRQARTVELQRVARREAREAAIRTEERIACAKRAHSVAERGQPSADPLDQAFRRGALAAAAAILAEIADE